MGAFLGISIIFAFLLSPLIFGHLALETFIRHKRNDKIGARKYLILTCAFLMIQVGPSIIQKEHIKRYVSNIGNGNVSNLDIGENDAVVFFSSRINTDCNDICTSYMLRYQNKSYYELFILNNSPNVNPLPDAARNVRGSSIIFQYYKVGIEECMKFVRGEINNDIEGVDSIILTRGLCIAKRSLDRFPRGFLFASGPMLSEFSWQEFRGELLKIYKIKNLRYELLYHYESGSRRYLRFPLVVEPLLYSSRCLPLRLAHTSYTYGSRKPTNQLIAEILNLRLPER